MNLRTKLLLICNYLGSVLSICVLDSKRGWWLDCGVRDSYLLRIKDIGGIQANFDFGIGFGDEKGFPNSISRVNQRGREIPTYLPPPPPNSYNPSHGVVPHETNYHTLSHSYGSTKPSYQSISTNYNPYNVGANTHSSYYDSHSPSYSSYGQQVNHGPSYLRKRMDRRKEKESKKSKFPYNFKLPFFKGSKSSERKFSGIRSTFLPSSPRGSLIKPKNSTMKTLPYNKSQYSYSSRTSKARTTDKQNEKNYKTSPRWVSVSRRDSDSSKIQPSNFQHGLYSHEIKHSLPKASPLKSAKKLNSEIQEWNSKKQGILSYSSKEQNYKKPVVLETNLKRRVMNSNTATNRRSFFSFSKKRRPQHKMIKSPQSLNPTIGMVPPPPFLVPTPPSYLNRHDQGFDSSHFGVFHHSVSTTTPRPTQTIGPALAEILKVPSYTVANSENVPSFAAKTFIVREAPTEFHPPNYDFYLPVFLTGKRVEIPRTKFYCEEQDYLPGIYADDMLGCKMFHLCVPSAVGSTITSYLCPNGTLFDQSILQCNYWYNVDCKSSIRDYDSNMALATSYRKINAAHLPLDEATNSETLSLLSQNLKRPNPSNFKLSRRRGKSLDISSKPDSTVIEGDSHDSSLSLHKIRNARVKNNESTSNFYHSSPSNNGNNERIDERLKKDGHSLNSNHGSRKEKHDITNPFTQSIRQAVVDVQNCFRQKRKDITDNMSNNMLILTAFLKQSQLTQASKFANSLYI